MGKYGVPNQSGEKCLMFPALKEVSKEAPEKRPMAKVPDDETQCESTGARNAAKGEHDQPEGPEPLPTPPFRDCNALGVQYNRYRGQGAAFPFKSCQAKPFNC